MPNITIAVNDAKQDQPLTHRDFEVSQDFQDNPDNTFYVAQDSLGKIHGTVMIGDRDRKAAGALVGNWVAAGLIVNRMPYKGMAKIIRAQESAAKEADMEKSPAGDLTPAAAPAAPVEPIA